MACSATPPATPSGAPGTPAATRQPSRYASAFADFNAALSGVSTSLFEVDANGGTLKLEPGPPVGDPCPHCSFGTATVTPWQAAQP